MVAFYVIEGTLLVLLAVALLTHVAWGVVTEMMDRAARRAEQRTPQPGKIEPPSKTFNEDDTTLDDYEPDESWLEMPVLVGPRRDSLRL